MAKKRSHPREALPEGTVIRTVYTSQVRRQQQRRTRIFFREGWPQLARDLSEIGSDGAAMRLWLALRLTAYLNRAEPDAWLAPKRWVLQSLNLNHTNYHRAVRRLERLGKVLVERHVGKRPRFRLIMRPALVVNGSEDTEDA